MPRRHQSPASKMGGHRTGRQGWGYPNRTDLNSGIAQPMATMPPVDITTGQPYPTAQSQNPPPQVPIPGSPGGAIHPAVVPLHAPTERPYEAVTAGLPIGAGANGNVMGLVLDQATAHDVLRGAASANPNDDMLALIHQLGPSSRVGG